MTLHSSESPHFPHLPPSLEVRRSGEKGSGLFAKKEFTPGEIIFTFHGNLLSQKNATNKALQIEDDLFLESTEGFDDYLNHSCSPNCSIRFTEGPQGQMVVELQADRPILPEEELSFDYHTTEYDMVDQMCDFVCHCGSDDCYHQVLGFRYLSRAQQERLRPHLSPYLLRILNGDDPHTSLR